MPGACSGVLKEIELGRFAHGQVEELVGLYLLIARRRDARVLAELAREVRLVSVAQRGGQRAQALAADFAPLERLERAAKAEHAGEALGRDAGGLLEEREEAPVAVAGLGHHLAHAGRVGRREPRKGVAHRRVQGPLAQPAH